MVEWAEGPFMVEMIAGLGLTTTMLCRWEKHFTAIFPACLQTRGRNAIADSTSTSKAGLNFEHNVICTTAKLSRYRRTKIDDQTYSLLSRKWEFFSEIFAIPKFVEIICCKLRHKQDEKI